MNKRGNIPQFTNVFRFYDDTVNHLWDRCKFLSAMSSVETLGDIFTVISMIELDFERKLKKDGFSR